MNWREEARRDRLVHAQIERDREAARLQLRLAERHALAQDRRNRAQAKATARQQSRKAQAARRAARSGWVRGHVVGLLFVPVIAVPAVLAWTAMATYGALLYGAAGIALPAFSEGAMWAFAAATTLTRHGHSDRPVWHLRLGTVVFAAVGAALNFAHGMTTAGGVRGPVTGVVYAVVSVSGVTVHQLVTAGPRRSPAEREAARLARAQARRQMAARRAALRHTVAEVDEHGNARLVYQPGPAVLARRHGRARLDPASDSHPMILAAGPTCPWPRPAPALPSTPRDIPAPGVSVPRAPRGHRNGQHPDTGTDTPRKRRRTSRPDTASAVARLRNRHPDMTAADIAARLGVTDRTVRRHLATRPATEPETTAA